MLECHGACNVHTTSYEGLRQGHEHGLCRADHSCGHDHINVLYANGLMRSLSSMMIHNMKRLIMPLKVETSGTCGVGSAVDKSQQKMRILGMLSVHYILARDEHVVDPEDSILDGQHYIKMSPMTNCRLWCDNKVWYIQSHNSIPH